MEEDNIKKEQGGGSILFSIIKTIFLTIPLIILGIIVGFIVVFGLGWSIFTWVVYIDEYSPLLVYIIFMWPFIALFVLSSIKGHENIIRWIKNIISFIYLGLTIYSVYKGVAYESRKWDLTALGSVIFAPSYFAYFIFIRLIIFLTKPSAPAKRKKIVLVIMGIILIALLLLSILH